MTEIFLKVGHGDLYPSSPQDAEKLGSLKPGQIYRAEITQPRNLNFHRKFFAMLDLAYDAWEPEEKTYKGQVVQKNRERFRKDIIILAGFYDTVVNLKGEVRAEAKSISFGKMEEVEFEQVYSRVVDVVLQKILTTYKRDDLDRVIEQMIGFA